MEGRFWIRVPFATATSPSVAVRKIGWVNERMLTLMTSIKGVVLEWKLFYTRCFYIITIGAFVVPTFN